MNQKFTQAYQLLENLTINRRRTKRSLNFLGSTIKMITGNLDHEDLLEIQNHIETLKNSNNALTTENNEQIKINQLFEDRINNLTKQAYIQSKTIDSIIKQNMLNSDRAVDWRHILHIHSIIFNIDAVQHQLSTIFESLQLSKLGVISKAFLQPPELEFATQLLESQGISITSYDQTYEFLEPVAFHNDSNIIIIIKIPKLKQGKYTQLQIETIPMKDKIISINASTAIVGNNESYLIAYPCTNIEKNNICNVENLFNISNDDCLHQILRGNPSNCTFVKTRMESEIKIINNLGVLIKNSIAPTLLQNNCGFGPRNLTGTFLISFKNCSISLDGKQFNSKMFKGETEVDILPLHSVNVEEATIETEPIDNLEQLHIHNRRKLEHLEIVHRKTGIFSIGTIFLVTGIIMAILSFIHREVRNLKMKVTVKVPTTSVADSSDPELNRDGSN